MIGAAMPWRTGVVLLVLGSISALVLPRQMSDPGAWDLLAVACAYGIVFIVLLYIVKPFPMGDTDLIARNLPLLSAIISWFSRHPRTFIGPDGHPVELSDRQKWGFAWVPESDVVADVGSSDQPLSSLLGVKARAVIALDTDSGALARLKRRAPAVRTIVARAESLPLQDESVDTALMLDVLEHTQDPQRSLNELYRVLRKTGTLIVSVPNGGMFRFLDPQNLGATVRGQGVLAPHQHYSRTDIERLFAGRFEISRLHYGGSVVYPITFWLAGFIRKHFSLDWSAWLRRVGDWDNDVSLGPLSYNLIVLARKL